MNADFQESLPDLLRLAALWLLVHSALPLAALCSRRGRSQKLLILAAGAISIGAGLLIAFNGGPRLGTPWLITIGFGAAFLPAAVVVAAIRFRDGPQAFTSAVVVAIVTLPIASIAGGLLCYAKAIERTPIAWIKVSSGEGQIIAAAFKRAAEDNFTVAASQGKITRKPTVPSGAHRLALWIFAQRLGGALQPGLNLAGAQVAEFLPTAESVEIIPIPDADGHVPCRAVAAVRLSYRLHLISPSAERSKSAADRVTEETGLFALEGMYSSAEESVRLDLVRSLDPSTPPSK